MMTENKRLGLALVLSAPSGTGKSTLIKKLCAEFPRLGFSVSCTTRAPRAGEQDGRDYHFVTREAFEKLRDSGYFAEWALVHGNYYGTPRAATLERLAQGEDALFDIDVQGARQLRASLGQGCHVFLLPPSRRVLEERLRKRGTDSDEVIRKRLGNAARELTQAENFDHLIVNDDLETAYAELRAAYLAAGTRPGLRPGLVSAILAGFAGQED